MVDLFGGVGGNAIAFALSGRWDRVICIERDAATLACAQRNAELYGVWSEVVDGAATAAVADQDEGEDEAEDADNDRGKSHGKSKGNGKDWQNSIAYDYEYGHEADTERLVGDDHDGSARLGNNGTVGWIIFVHADCFEYLRRLRVLRTLREGLHDDVGSGTASSVMQTTESATTAKNISKTARNRRRRLRNRRLAKACGLHHSLWTAPGEAVLFASPPWGGPSYANRDGNVFDLEAMEPYSLSTLSSAMAEWHHALYLPRTSDLRQIARLVDVDTDGESNEKKKIDVVQYCMNGFSKAMVAYFPARQQAAAASSGSSVRENRTTTPLSSAESSIRRQLEST